LGTIKDWEYFEHQATISFSRRILLARVWKLVTMPVVQEK